LYKIDIKMKFFSRIFWKI